MRTAQPILHSGIVLGTLLFFVSLPGYAEQDEVQIDWSSKSLAYSPPIINEIMKVKVTVRNVNDLLYSYRARVAATPRSTSTFSPEAFQTFLAQPQPGVTGVCDTAWEPFARVVARIRLNLTANRDLNPIAAADPTHPATKLRDDEPRSVALADTVKAWNTYIQPDVNQAQLLMQAVGTACATDAAKMASLRDFEFMTNKWFTKINSAHDFVFGITLAPDNDYCIFITEFFGEVKTATGEQKFCFSPASTLITLSGGYLFTQVAGRTYDRQSIPGQTDPVLVVNQSGPIRSVFTSLVNVEIPYLNDFDWEKHGKLGFAFSIGPVLQLGTGSNNVSKLGLFGGISVHFGHVFYLSPGVHVGEFTDFPAGFTHSGQSIPSGFTGPLAPVKRNTARLALAITFKGFDLKKKQSKAAAGSNGQ